MVKKEVEHAIQRVYMYTLVSSKKKKKRILETLWPILKFYSKIRLTSGNWPHDTARP